MYPVLFEIPGLGMPLRAFGVLVAIGFLFGIWVWGRLLARYGVDREKDPERASHVALWLLLGVVFGARFMYVAVEVSRYLGADKTPGIEAYLEGDDRGAAAARLLSEDPAALEKAREISVGHAFLQEPFRVFFVWEGGLVMYGGFFGAVLFGLWQGKKRGLHPWNALDTGLIAGFVGQAIGRWGCLLVGDDYGSVVPERFEGLPFPLTIQVPNAEWLRANPESLFPPDLAEKTLWATQPWMSLNALLVALAGYLVLKRQRWHGQAAAWILMHYSATRFAIEFFRGDEVRGVWFGGALSTSQLIAIPGFLIGLGLLLRFRGRRDAGAAGSGGAALAEGHGA